MRSPLSPRLTRAILAGAATLLCTAAQAAPTEEWASSVLGFSSQWSAGGWSAAQALGEPDTFGYGDINTAWAPAPSNGTREFISLGFATPTYATGALIRETYGNGFVYQIDAIDTLGGVHTVWTGTDPSQPGTPVDFLANWAPTAFLTRGLTIHVDTNHNLGAWEEIDAVKLYGDTTPVPEPGGVALALGGLGLLGARTLLARRRQRG